MQLQTLRTPPATQVNFINHFSGCQLCTQQNKEGDYGVCEAEYTKSFEYANGVFSKLLKRMPPRDITHQMQLAATPYCKVCSSFSHTMHTLGSLSSSAGHV